MTSPHLKLLSTSFLACALALSAPTLQAADAEEGRELAWTYHCVTCHGMQGQGVDSRYPNLGGQDEAYLVARLQYFRNETEPFNHMNGQARPLTDEEMRQLAAYFSAQSK